MVALLGFDCLWFDLEHHSTSVETANQMMRAARAGEADVMARPGKGEFMRMARLLEAGAHGILYPRCDNAAEATEVVRWSKFAPLGERGIDGGNPDMPYVSMEVAEYVRVANEETFVAVQIESPSAVENAAAIAEVKGVDLLFFGPADFSVLSGIPGQFSHQRVLSAAEKVCAAARSAGKHFGTTCGSSDQLNRLLKMGTSLVCYSSDIGILKQGWESILQTYRSAASSTGT